MLNREPRIKKVTSSQASRLCASLKNGNPSSAFYTYVEEVFSEHLLDADASVKVDVKAMRWGKLMEVVAVDLLFPDSFDIHYDSEEPIINKDNPFHAGTPDFINGDTVGEVKCYYNKKFALLTHCINQKNVDLFRNKFPSEYYQIVSNSILTGCKYGMIVTFLPKDETLNRVMDWISDPKWLENKKLSPDYVFMTDDYDKGHLPCLGENAKIDQLNTFKFEVPQEDKDFLTERVELAEVELKKLLK